MAGERWIKLAAVSGFFFVNFLYVLRGGTARKVRLRSPHE